MKDTEVTISVASMPSREHGLLETVRRLLPQCDHMNVCLNDYPFVPAELVHPKITTVQLYADDALSDRGKFYWCATMLGYHLTADDDIIYPYDYVKTLVAKIEQYKRRAIISYHGSRFHVAYGHLVNHPFSRQLIRFGDTTDCDIQAHMLGTGVAGYHTSLMNFNYTHMPISGTDEHLAVYAQERRIPMILAIHRRGWLMDNKQASVTNSICARGDIQQLMINMLCTYKQWRYYGDSNENNRIHV